MLDGRGEFFAGEKPTAEVEMRVGRVGVELDGAVEAGLCVFTMAGEQLRIAQRGVRGCVPRRGGCGSLENFESASRFVECDERVAEADLRGDGFGGVLEDALIRVARFVDSALLFHEHAEVEMSVGVVRVEHDGIAIALLGFCGFSACFEGIAEIIVEGRGVGADGDGAADEIDGEAGFADLIGENAEKVERVGVLGIG